jgi:hypothetical protein
LVISNSHSTLGIGFGFTRCSAGVSELDAAAFDFDPLRQPETVELVSAYYRIDDPALRRRLFDLARALAGGA